MLRSVTGIVIFLLPLAASAEPGQLQIGIGVFALAKEGADIQISYRPPQSAWQFGYRYARWTEVFHDPYTGNAHSSSSHILAGPVLSYLLQPEQDDSFYAGISLLKWTRTETPLLIAAPSGSNSTTDLYFGGGYTGRLGPHFYYNLGLFFAPNARLDTQTAISSEQSDGGFDIQIQAGMRY